MNKNNFLSFIYFRERMNYRLFASLLFFMLLTTNSWGQVLWSDPTGTDWLNTASWTGGAVPNSTSIAQFGVNPTGTAVGMSLSTTQQVGAVEMTSDRTSPLTIGNSGTTLTGLLQLNSTTVNGVANTILRNNSSSLLTIQNNAVAGSGSTLGIALTNTTNNIINTDGTGGITISSIVSGACPLTKTGTGTLTLNASNTYTGVNAIQGGKVIIGNSAALGTNNTSNAGYVTISNGATLDLNGKAISGSARGASINGTGISGSGAIMNSSSTTGSIGGQIALQGASSIIGETGLISLSKTGPFMTGAFGLTLGGSQGGSAAGTIAGITSLTKIGSGTWTLSGTNTFTTGVTLNEGTLNINSVAALGTVAGTFTISSGTINNTSAAAITTNNYPQIWNGDFSFTGTQDLNLGTGAVSLGSVAGSTRTLTINGGNLTIGGIISNGSNGTTPTINFTKAGTGTLTLNGANAYTGISNIQGGKVIIGNNAALGVNNISNAGYVTISNGATLDLNGKAITGAARGATISGTGISGGGAIMNSGGAASIAGAITLASSASIVGESGLITFSKNDGISGTDVNLTLGGAQGGTLTAGGITLGTGSLIKNGGGTWTTNKNCSFIGTTTINGGTLALNPNSNYTLSSAVILNGGTFSSVGFVGTAIDAKILTCTSLQLQSSSTIALGTSSSSLNTIRFNDSHSIAWTNGATLTVTGWTGNAGSAGTVGRLFALPNGTTNVGLTPSQLAQISFTGYANTSAMLTLGGEVIPVTMPTLTAATGATVDAPFNITFSEQATWRNAITGITVNGTTLDPSAYNTSVAGKITFNPANSDLLQSAGTKTIVISTSGIKAGAVTATFIDLTVSQAIGIGAPAKLAIITQPTAPTSNGAVLAAQPIIAIQDQYGNATTSTANVVASVETGTWTLGGTATVAGVNGTSTFSGLTATSAAAVTGATITFTSGSLTSSTSGVFDIPAPPVVTTTVNVSDLGLNANSVVTINSGSELTINQATNVNSIIVNPGAKITVSGTNALTATNGITLESDASGTATIVDSYATPTILATVKQYVTAGRNWYLSAPTNSTANVSVLDKGASVQEYNETSGLWQIAAGTLTRGKGYIQVAGSTEGTTGTVSFNGTTNSGNVAVTLTNNSGGGNGFNLVGNPYPSYISWSAVANDALNTNVTTGAKMPTGTIWYRTIYYNGKSPWAANTAYNANDVVYNGTRFYRATSTGMSGNSGGPTGGVGTTGFVDGTVSWNYEGTAYIFATVNSAGQVSPATVSNLIPPMQAFWVKSNGGTLTFTNSMRQHETVTNKLKAPKKALNEMPFIRLRVTNGASADESVIYADANASNNFDSQDAPKYFNMAGSNQPEIFTQAGNEKLVINALNEINPGTEIQLGFLTDKANTFSISASEFRNFNTDTQIILKDKIQKSEYNLSTGDSYNFSSDVVNNADRFSIIFRSAGISTKLNNTESSNVQVFVNAANQITIIAPEKATYSIYNAVGMLFENGKTTGKLQTLNCKLNTGVYVVKVNNQSTRVVIK